MSYMIRQNSLIVLCKMVLPVIRNGLKGLESIIKKRKLRRIFLPWNDIEMKEFIHKFFEITNGELYGYSKRLELQTFWKIVKMKYDNSITVSN